MYKPLIDELDHMNLPSAFAKRARTHARLALENLHLPASFRIPLVSRLALVIDDVIGARREAQETAHMEGRRRRRTRRIDKQSNRLGVYIGS